MRTDGEAQAAGWRAAWSLFDDSRPPPIAASANDLTQIHETKPSTQPS